MMYGFWGSLRSWGRGPSSVKFEFWMCIGAISQHLGTIFSISVAFGKKNIADHRKNRGYPYALSFSLILRINLQKETKVRL